MSRKQRIQLQIMYLLRQIDKPARREILWNEIVRETKGNNEAIKWMLDAFGIFIENEAKEIRFVKGNRRK